MNDRMHILLTLLQGVITAILCLTLAGATSPAAAQQQMNSYVSADRTLFLERIEIRGAERVAQEQIRDAVTLQPGDTLSVERLESARLRVMACHHLIRDVGLATRPGERRGSIILEIEIWERSPWSFETGFGYHDIYGWFLTLAGVRREPVSLTGLSWRTGVRLGFHLAGIDAEWEKPGLATDGIGVGGRL